MYFVYVYIYINIYIYICILAWYTPCSFLVFGLKHHPHSAIWGRGTGTCSVGWIFDRQMMGGENGDGAVSAEGKVSHSYRSFLLVRGSRSAQVDGFMYCHNRAIMGYRKKHKLLDNMINAADFLDGGRGKGQYKVLFVG